MHMYIKNVHVGETVWFKTMLIFSMSMDICGCNGWFNIFDNCENTIPLQVNVYLEVKRLIGKLILITVTVVSLESLLFPGRFLGSRTKGTNNVQWVIILRDLQWGILTSIIPIGGLQLVCYWQFSQYRDSYHSVNCTMFTSQGCKQWFLCDNDLWEFHLATSSANIVTASMFVESNFHWMKH